MIPPPSDRGCGSARADRVWLSWVPATCAAPIGGMMTDRRTSPHPYWLYYFVVDDIDAGLQRVKANGGMVLFGPQEVPGGAWIINAQDPQGGAFALVGARKA